MIPKNTSYYNNNKNIKFSYFISEPVYIHNIIYRDGV